MRRVAVFASIGLFAAACGGGPGSTPQETFVMAKAALENHDGQAIYDLLCPEGQAAAVHELKTLQADVASGVELPGPKLSKEQIDALVALKTGPGFLQWGMRNIPDYRTFDIASVRIVKTKVEGDHAWLSVTSSKGDGEFEMVRLGGKWYLFSGFPF